MVGDIAVATFKANSRNAVLLEEYLRIRGEEYLKVCQPWITTIMANLNCCNQAAAKRSQNTIGATPSAGGSVSERKSGTVSKLFGFRKAKVRWVPSEPNTCGLQPGFTLRKPLWTLTLNSLLTQRRLIT